MPTGTPGRSPHPSGFSLIEILVVITIIGLLMTIGFGPVQNALESGRVTKCRKQLADLGQSMLIYKDQNNKGKWPKESGMRFLLRLYKAGLVAGRNSETFLCPGTPDINDTGPSGEPGSAYEDWDNIDSTTISYAGRDQEAYPFKGGDASTVVVASDDNEGRPNHRKVTNILYADGSTGTFDITSEQAETLLAEFPEVEETGLPIGPDCPYEPLQVLRVD